LRRRTSRPRSTPSTPPTQHIPNAGYVEKISTQLAAGDPPDIAYLDETQAFPWAAEGKLLDLTPYFDGQPERTLVKNIVYRARDHLLGSGLATGGILTYHNPAAGYRRLHDGQRPEALSNARVVADVRGENR
jgi:hypothetical protein